MKGKGKSLLESLEEMVKASPHDKEEMRKFILSFPYQKYLVYSVPELGSFYIDLPEDMIKLRLSQGMVWDEHIHREIERHAKESSTVVDLGYPLT